MISSANRNPAPPTATFAPDCRRYLGDKPCEQNRLCDDCDAYEPWSQRICIIKLGALGDVLRTVCVLPYLREQYPDVHVTWVSQPNGCRLLQGHPAIDRVMTFNAVNALVLQQERFDQVISLDKEPEPCALARSLHTDQLLGITLSDFGTPVPATAAAVSYFELGLSDERKFFRNTDSYPKLIYSALGWNYDGQKYDLTVSDANVATARAHLAERGHDATRPTVGINVGAGKRFVNKMWPTWRIVDVIKRLQDRMPGTQVVLLGGPDEADGIQAIHAALREQGRGDSVITTACDHSEQAFVALVSRCDVLFTGDTMAMHAAVATDTRIVAFLGPTCEQEIDLFGLGEKLVAEVPCAPCYKQTCNEHDVCVKAISDEQIVDAVQRQFARLTQTATQAGDIPLPVMNTRAA